MAGEPVGMSCDALSRSSTALNIAVKSDRLPCQRKGQSHVFLSALPSATAGDAPPFSHVSRLSTLKRSDSSTRESSERSSDGFSASSTIGILPVVSYFFTCAARARGWEGDSRRLPARRGAAAPEHGLLAASGAC